MPASSLKKQTTTRTPQTSKKQEVTIRIAKTVPQSSPAVPQRIPTMRDALPPRPQSTLPPRGPRRAPLRSLHGLFSYIGATGIALCVIGGGMWYMVSGRATPEQKKAAYVQGVVQTISKLVVVPEGETPTIGVIPDPASITDNKEFFKNAAQGDYLVVFPHARLMLIYSPSKNLVVNMGYAAAPALEEKKENKKSN